MNAPERDDQHEAVKPGEVHGSRQLVTPAGADGARKLQSRATRAPPVKPATRSARAEERPRRVKALRGRGRWPSASVSVRCRGASGARSEQDPVVPAAWHRQRREEHRDQSTEQGEPDEAVRSTVFISQAYAVQGHQSAASTSTPRPIPANVGSSVSSVVTCVNAKTNTRSKKSSRGVTGCSCSTAVAGTARDYRCAGLSLYQTAQRGDDLAPRTVNTVGTTAHKKRLNTSAGCASARCCAARTDRRVGRSANARRKRQKAGITQERWQGGSKSDRARTTARSRLARAVDVPSGMWHAVARLSRAPYADRKQRSGNGEPDEAGTRDVEAMPPPRCARRTPTSSV